MIRPPDEAALGLSGKPLADGQLIPTDLVVANCNAGDMARGPSHRRFVPAAFQAVTL
jgi:hypothetical protein